MTIRATSPDFFPETNLNIAKHLFAIEVGLRELIIEEFPRDAEPDWFKGNLLPADVAQNCLRRLKLERSKTWTSHISHHPLYYIDFPDLAKVLGKHWKQHFQRVCDDRSVFLNNLRTLEPIRNKLAHNRKTTETDCKVVLGVFAQLESAIGPDHFYTLVNKGSSAPSIPSAIDALIQDVTTAQDVLMSLGEGTPVSSWQKAKSAWWFESNFLTATDYGDQLEAAQLAFSELEKEVDRQKRRVEGLKKKYSVQSRQHSEEADVLVPISRFFEVYEEYTDQPRTRGSGHLLEAWRNRHDIRGLAEDALKALARLKKEAPNE